MYQLLAEDARRAAEQRHLINGARRTAPHRANLDGERELESLRSSVLRYLRAPAAAAQSEAEVAAFLERTKDLGLTKGEMLQLINLRPTHLVEVYLVRAPPAPLAPWRDHSLHAPGAHPVPPPVRAPAPTAGG